MNIGCDTVCSFSFHVLYLCRIEPVVQMASATSATFAVGQGNGAQSIAATRAYVAELSPKIAAQLEQIVAKLRRGLVMSTLAFEMCRGRRRRRLS